ncbi:MAG: prenyltransferase/squalene oxidase repeat-containing protein, partial [Planctomycetota bacterium]
MNPPNNRRRFLAAAIAGGVSGVIGSSLARQVSADDDAVRERWAAVDARFTVQTLYAINRGLRFLAKRQLPGGNFPGQMGSNVAVVSLAGLAWLAAGYLPNRGRYGVYLQRAIDFIAASMRLDGMLIRPDAVSRGAMYGHGFAALFLAETYGITARGDMLRGVQRATNLIVTAQNREGGWRYQPVPQDADVSMTVCQLMALRAAKNAGVFVPAETITNATDYLRRCQNTDGGFMYQAGGSESRFPLTAGAIVALQNAGRYQGQELERAYAYLLRRQSVNLQPRQNNYFFYAHYYSVQAFWQRGDAAFNRWYGPLRDVLLQRQRPDGDWQ